MSDTPTLPIVVPASAAKAIGTALLRHALTAAGGILVARGYLDQGVANQAVDQVLGLLLVLAAPIWAIVRAKVGHTKLVTTAAAAPDTVAVVEGG